MDRNLDGVYFRVQRDGKWGNTCFSDLTQEEMMALSQMEFAKLQLSYMCRYDTPNGGVTYELSKDKKNMHDDHAYTLAEGAFALALLRREDLLSPKNSTGFDYSSAPICASSISF